jgi:hypothetical protein
MGNPNLLDVLSVRINTMAKGIEVIITLVGKEEGE